MSKAPCPYLVREDVNGGQQSPIDYPSFENICLVTEHPQSLMLADQATFCLSGSCQFCTRYQAAIVQDMTNEGIMWNDPTTTTDRRDTTEGAREAIIADELSSPEDRTPAFFTKNQGFTEDQRAGTEWRSNEELPSELFAADGSAFGNRVWPQLTRRWYSWAVAVLLFFAVIMVGGIFAAYTGWQIALDRLASARAGQINTLASAPIEQTQPRFVVMTATTESQEISVPTTTPPAIGVRSGLEAKNNESNPGTASTDPEPADQGNEFPPAVTATPVILVPLPTERQSDSGQVAVIPANPAEQQQQPTATFATIQLPSAESTPTPVPIIDVQLAVPTRRPTPAFDIPTSTPAPPQPTPTETPLPILGTPIVVFAADEQRIPPGECTHVRWHVENVRAVYYESQPAFGDGTKEECVDDEADSYALTVIFGDGQTKIYTTTVGILWPTPTPSITPSFTPEILPTETWTPEPPTPTPTPNVIYGTTLAINGENPYRCSAGNECNIGVLATNTGDSIDTLAIEFLAVGNWPATLCSQIGTCSTQRLVIANVGPQNTVYTTLKLTIPADSVGQSSMYALRAVSDASQGSVTSQVIELTIESTE